MSETKREQYDQDKVYLRDIRSGQIYLYEAHLAKNSNFEACVPNPSVVEPKVESSDED